MSAVLQTEPLTREAFAPFGEVLEASGPSFPISAGRCDRFHDQAQLDFAGELARPILSVFRSRPVRLPYALTLLERHPLGSQAFAPMHADPFLVVVADDEDGVPARLRAFMTQSGQGVNIRRNVWHGPLTPLGREADFLVVDRGGGAPGDNLEKHVFESPIVVQA